jgi:1-acyl-sn-glycerol-3-phosphate acyltransferase
MKSIVRYSKILWIFLWAGAMTLLVFFPMIVSSLLSSTGNLPFSISKLWARVILLVSAARVEIHGREKIQKGQSYVIISNHQSHYDIPAIITSLGIQFRWIIKQEILKIPLFGYALYASRNIFIDRSNPERARESIRKGLNRLPAGASVMFFAEGTRSPDGQLKEFKKGGFAAAIEKKFPILPITVNGSRKVLPKGALEFRPGRISLTVGDPIDTSDYDQQSMGDLMAKTRDVIESSLILG